MDANVKKHAYFAVITLIWLGVFAVFCVMLVGGLWVIDSLPRQTSTVVVQSSQVNTEAPMLCPPLETKKGK
jgi:cell division septal protein FtsQ